MAQGAGALEHVEIGETETDGPAAQEGIVFGIAFLPGGVFVGTKIESADDDGAAAELTDGFGVCVVVVFLGGFFFGGEVEEFGAVEADADGRLW